MTKTLFLDPNKMREPDVIRTPDIPVNAWQKRMADVKDAFSRQELIGMYFDMRVIREFETMLQEIRHKGSYRGVAYDYTGPSHLCIGQESAAVGQAFALDVQDAIFGSHRSHGDVIAKGMAAIRKMGEDELNEVMRSFQGGRQLEIAAKGFKGDMKDLARRFFVYGMIAEIFGRETGFAKGLGNSMHVFFLPFGIYPNNAIVGGSAPIAAGAALYKKVMQIKGVVVANIGDGAAGCGPVWEALNFSAMDQFNTLWEEKGGLPILFCFSNNGYGMGGQTDGETMGYGRLARVGAGVNPQAMHAERIDGYNVFAVIDAIRRKKRLLESGQGPALLDVVTYRLCGHSTSDANPYRTQEEIRSWEKADAIPDYAGQLVETGVSTQEEVRAVEAQAAELIGGMFALAADEGVSPRMDPQREEDAIARYMFSNRRVDKMAEGEPRVLAHREENPRLTRIRKKSRSGLKDGKALPSVAVVQMRDAIFEAMIDKYYMDPSLVSYGEDVRDWGTAFGVYKDLDRSIPYSRLFNAPISEAAIVSGAVGYAMMGGRAVPELMYSDFLGRAGDEVFNQLAKWQAMTAGQIKMPVVLRMSVGSKYGAQHSQDWSSLCAHVPGLKVVYPATPYDAKGLLNAALSGTDPVVFFEHQSLYGIGELFRPEVPETYYEVPIGEPDIKKTGSGLTILTIGKTLYAAMECAARMESEFGVSTEVIDARSIVPFNYEKVLESVKKTGRIIIASDACQRCSMINDFAQNITAMAFDDLDAPPAVVGARNWITPVFELEKDFFPQADWLIDAYHQTIQPLPGHKPRLAFCRESMKKRGSLGV